MGEKSEFLKYNISSSGPQKIKAEESGCKLGR